VKSAFRTALAVGLALLLVALEASLSHLLGGGVLTAVLPLPVVVWLGLEAGLTDGALAAAAVGLVLDSAAGGPVGLFTCLSVLLFLGTRAAGGAFDARAPLGFALLCGTGTFAFGLVALSLLRYVSPAEAAPRWGLAGRVLLEAVLTALAAPAVRLTLARLTARAQREEPGLLP